MASWLSRQPRWRKRLIVSAVAAAVFGIGLYIAKYYEYQTCPIPSGIPFMDAFFPQSDCLTAGFAKLIMSAGLAISLPFAVIFGYMVLSGHDFDEQVGRKS